MRRTFIAVIGFLSVSNLLQPLFAQVPEPHAAKILTANCIRPPYVARLSNSMRPISVLCQMEDGPAGWPGDFPPPHFQLPSGYPNREPATLPSPSPTTGTASSSALPRSSSARK
jgi:hypothetical protein